ncbi:MAG TPA: KpsF/GutQ family sugar-phosphate isomerase [Chthoniobacterales bacterium]|nr:KpsF/GutQ family sugar-phosphate isomerase [Chthoniobacterales bacterium]
MDDLDKLGTTDLEQARHVLRVEIYELERLANRLDKRFSAAVQILRQAVEEGRKIIVLGVGKSGQIGEKIAATLTSTGSPAVALNPLNALHGDLGIVATGDAVLAMSYSGETAELLNILPALKRFDVQIVAFTGDLSSTLAKHSDVALDCSIEQEACPLNLAPTSSTTVMLALGDALAMVLLQERGFQKEDFAKFHPGGRLGRALLQRVTDVMRGRDRMPTVTPDTGILAVLHAMNQCRAGVAVVVDGSGILAGIFTHGDFVRAFEDRPAMVQEPVGSYMIRHPITIRSDRLAVEVLNILDQHRIDDLIVVDESNRPVGIIDSQDLTKVKLL